MKYVATIIILASVGYTPCRADQLNSAIGIPTKEPGIITRTAHCLSVPAHWLLKVAKKTPKAIARTTFHPVITAREVGHAIDLGARDLSIRIAPYNGLLEFAGALANIGTAAGIYARNYR